MSINPCHRPIIRAAIASVALALLSLPAQASLFWQTSRSAAISLAQAQGKTILLLSGRDTCGNCM